MSSVHHLDIFLTFSGWDIVLLFLGLVVLTIIAAFARALIGGLVDEAFAAARGDREEGVKLTATFRAGNVVSPGTWPGKEDPQGRPLYSGDDMPPLP